ncbi:hypothetical protein D3C73_993820 [compost metagenome]
MPGVNVRPLGQAQRLKRCIGQRVLILVRNFSATCIYSTQFIQLHQGDGSIDIGQVVLVPRGYNFRLRCTTKGLPVIGIHAQTVEFQTTQTLRERTVVGHDQSTFRAGNIFDGVKGENRRTAGANMTALV